MTRLDHAPPGARRDARGNRCDRGRLRPPATRCGPDPDGSTLRTTYQDPDGTGVLTPARGEPLRARTELGPPARTVAVLATIAHVTDAHVLDAESPARVTFLDRLGPPFQSTFRPQETLTAQVLAGSLYAIRALRPDAVIQGGDLIDNDQANELALALAVMNGGPARPGSGAPGYFGVQSPFDADPFYYRPDLDAPRHPGSAPGGHAGVHQPRRDGAPGTPCSATTTSSSPARSPRPAQTRALALGDEAVWDLPPGLTVPPGLSAARDATSGVGYSPDGPPSPGLVERFLAQALSGPKVRVPPDPGRRELDPDGGARRAPGGLGTARNRTRCSTIAPTSEPTSACSCSTSRVAAAAPVASSTRPARVAGRRARRRRRAVDPRRSPTSRSPARRAASQILELLDRDPRVIAAISGHIHRNRIVARPTPAGGYWLISTASLIDYPQQARALRVLATADGGVAIQTWMLDHVFPGRARHDLAPARLPRRPGRQAARGSSATGSTGT